MESEPSALTFSTISDAEVEELIALQKQILTEGKSHIAEHFGKPYWQWQYKQLPTHRSEVFICKSNQEIAGYYHAPVYEMQVNGTKKLFAVVQDVAVSNKLRGQGVFRKLAEFATHGLMQSGMDAVYTYPNDKSIKTFLKYNGYRNIFTYDSFLLPLDYRKLIRSRISVPVLSDAAGSFLNLLLRRRFKAKSNENFSVVGKADEATASFFHRFSNSFKVSRLRDLNYLHWRYDQRPDSTYFYVTYAEDEQLKAAAVFKNDKMLNAEALLMMDFAFLEEKHLHRLLKYVAKHAGKVSGSAPVLIFAAYCCSRINSLAGAGFFKVPEKANPRPVHLLVKNMKADESLLFKPENWFATLGDWDVF